MSAPLDAIRLLLIGFPPKSTCPIVRLHSQVNAVGMTLSRCEAEPDLTVL